MNKKMIAIAVIFLITGAALFVWNVYWLYYATGLFHSILLFGTIGKWIAAEQDRRFTKWLRETTDAASADIASVE